MAEVLGMVGERFRRQVILGGHADSMRRKGVPRSFEELAALFVGLGGGDDGDVEAHGLLARSPR
jgi:hypothetical protein